MKYIKNIQEFIFFINFIFYFYCLNEAMVKNVLPDGDDDAGSSKICSTC
jgi:hypothetical protein